MEVIDFNLSSYSQVNTSHQHNLSLSPRLCYDLVLTLGTERLAVLSEQSFLLILKLDWSLKSLCVYRTWSYFLHE